MTLHALRPSTSLQNVQQYTRDVRVYREFQLESGRAYDWVRRGLSTLMSLPQSMCSSKYQHNHYVTNNYMQAISNSICGSNTIDINFLMVRGTPNYHLYYLILSCSAILSYLNRGTMYVEEFTLARYRNTDLGNIQIYDNRIPLTSAICHSLITESIYR